jgi:hypothetical protein
MIHDYYCHVYHSEDDLQAIKAICKQMHCLYRPLPRPDIRLSAHILYNEGHINPLTTAFRLADIHLQLVSWGPMSEVEEFAKHL